MDRDQELDFNSQNVPLGLPADRPFPGLVTSIINNKRKDGKE
jgi:hypothetical protein